MLIKLGTSLQDPWRMNVLCVVPNEKQLFHCAQTQQNHDLPQISGTPNGFLDVLWVVFWEKGVFAVLERAFSR